MKYKFGETHRCRVGRTVTRPQGRPEPILIVCLAGNGTVKLESHPHPLRFGCGLVLSETERPVRQRTAAVERKTTRDYCSAYVISAPDLLSSLRARSPTPPNILFVMTDQQRFDPIAALGHGPAPTPHLDRLVRRGVACTNAYATCPVCMPSRYTLLTGCEPSRTSWLVRRSVGSS